ncbi:MAG: hypothetical protein JWM58_188 [Rhizobium sp.]|nr:hypothetical protein [Rhizobium sp.]
MELWIGPAIVAAVISGLISLTGLYLGGWITIRHDRRRRREKVRDFQIALRAEIRSELHNLLSIDFDKHFEEVKSRYARQQDYSVFPSFPARHVIFEALKEEIHLLPEAVIDDIILYSRQRHAIEKFVEDMRDPRFSKLSPERQLEMYGDFIEMQKFLSETARFSVDALDKSLGTKTRISIPASGLSVP